MQSEQLARAKESETEDLRKAYEVPAMHAKQAFLEDGVNA